jgi:hypothetical protein
MLFYVPFLGSCSLFVVVSLSEQPSIPDLVELRKISIVLCYLFFYNCYSNEISYRSKNNNLTLHDIPIYELSLE